jgi:hypothetical protein
VAISLACSSTLKMEAILSSKISVDFLRSTMPYILEDRTLHNHRCENSKSYVVKKIAILYLGILDSR